jgi:hypothetical protein
VLLTGKLCRNPFSTIKLSHEDGGSKAGIREGRRLSAILRQHTICKRTQFWISCRTGGHCVSGVRWGDSVGAIGAMTCHPLDVV